MGFRLYVAVMAGVLFALLAASAALGIWQLIDAPAVVQWIAAGAFVVAILIGIVAWRAAREV